MMKVGIAGAGLLGRVLALELVTQGIDITLFDRDTLNGEHSCGYTAAGMITPYAELTKAETLIFNLGLRAFDYWPDILAKLATPVTLQQAGSLVVAYQQDHAELTRFRSYLTTKLTDIALPILTNDALTKIEPELKPKNLTGFYLAAEGHIDNIALFHALQTTLCNKDVTWKTKHTVTQVKPYSCVANDREYRFDHMFDCRGLGAQSSFPKLRGVRGELIWVHAPEVNFTHPIRVMHPRYQLYIVPRADHHFVVGASELESEDMSDLSIRTALELLTVLYSLHSGFAEARIVNTLVNCRPALPDNLPKIKHCEGLTAINGLYRHGYLLTPVLIRECLNLLNDGIDKIEHPELLCSL